MTVLYLLMVGLGMLFNYQKYSEFGINIFEYADIFDFLIAPFEDVRIVYFSVIFLLIPFIFSGSILLWKKNSQGFTQGSILD